MCLTADHYVKLLRAVVAQPSEPLRNLPLLGEGEEEQVLHAFNQADCLDPGPELTFVDLFERQVVQGPDRPCVECEGESMSYAQVEGRANQLAHLLVYLGVGPEVAVGLYMEHGLDLLPTLLAIMKAGGCFLPLDPRSPRNQLDHVLAELQPRVVLTHTPLLSLSSRQQQQRQPELSLSLPSGCVLVVIDMPVWAAQIAAQPHSRARSSLAPPAAALLLPCYCQDPEMPSDPPDPEGQGQGHSCSRPASVEVEQRSLSAFAAWCVARYRLVGEDTVMASGRLGSRLLLGQWAGVLAAGGRLLLLRPHGQDLARMQLEAIRTRQVRVFLHACMRRVRVCARADVLMSDFFCGVYICECGKRYTGEASLLTKRVVVLVTLY